MTGDAGLERLARFAPAGARRFRAPGRVNLMGDHTDYNDGLVFPMAIERDCTVAAAPNEAGRVRVRSLEEAHAVDIAADGSDEPADVEPAWGRYVAGVVRVLAERGRPALGIDAVVSSTVPAGSGLSSSAALEVACALALCEAGGLELSAVELALACQAAEHLATGVPSGIMDQLAATAARPGAALVIDCLDLSLEHVPVPGDLAVVVAHSGIRRELDRTPYAERRAACAAIAAQLGLVTLRDAELEQVRDLPLARHVVTENGRVRATAHALAAGDRPALGALFAASHASLRDDYCVSTPELDLLVEALVDAGAVGARLTGAGFGGSVVALSEPASAATVVEAATSRYREATRLEPTAFVTLAAAGAGPAP